LVFSFFANKKFTFKNNSSNQVKQFAVFLAITLIGLWIIQPLIINGSGILFEKIVLNTDLSLLISKLLATIASLIWNYLMYRKFVFAD